MGGKEIIMYRKPRDFNAAECMIWMFKFNPGKVDVHMDGAYPRYLIPLVPINQLKFPESWYYCEETKTLNKESSNITVRVVFKK